MRLEIRDALKQTAGAIAVVTGAWHVPALRSAPSAAAEPRAGAEPAEAEDRRDLGAMDRNPPRHRKRIRRRRGLARMVRPPLVAE